MIVWLPICEGYPNAPKTVWWPALRGNMEGRDVVFENEPCGERIDGWQDRVEKLLALK